MCLDRSIIGMEATKRQRHHMKDMTAHDSDLYQQQACMTQK